ncbi:MAG: HI0074 family nucleotidyltransferase substrate-binding subunit [Alkalispirochaeta sp.]
MNASKDTRWQQRFENLERAFGLLQEAAGRQSLSDLEAEGMVQRFEYTFELAWKTLKDFLELQGFSVAYPRDVLKTAFQTELIAMGDAWFEMLDRRNEAAHTYDRERFVEITNAIRTRFLPALTALVDRLNQERGQFGLMPAHVEAIAAVLRDFDEIERVVVFGSRAMGTFKTGSDVDLCVFGTNVDAELARRVERTLNEKTPTPYRVDVLAYNAIENASLRQHVDQAGVPIF